MHAFLGWSPVAGVSRPHNTGRQERQEVRWMEPRPARLPYAKMGLDSPNPVITNSSLALVAATYSKHRS